MASNVYERLRDDFRAGQFAPGSKLRIDTLMERYGFGRTPIREALNRLSSEALVVQEDKRGFRVPSISIEDLEELARTRCWIYEIGLRESIARGGADWEEAIVLAHHRLLRAEQHARGLPTVDPELDRLHRAFHASLISACGSHWIHDLAEKLFDLSDRYRAVALITRVDRDATAEHARIFEAVINRNAAMAIELTNAHINLTADLAKESLARA